MALLIAAGADPDATLSVPGPGETPLHWAASSDDADVAAALIDGGADAGRPVRPSRAARRSTTPSATGAGTSRACSWPGARGSTGSGRRAALGLQARVEELLAGAAADELDEAFWQACHGGQRRTAEYLLDRGADAAATPHYAGGQAALDVAASPDTRRDALVTWLRERGASAG